MEGLGMRRSTTRHLAIACSMMLFVFLASPTHSSPTPSPTPTPAKPPRNLRVYRCGEGCAQKCMGIAEKSEDQFTSCTIGCMDPCVRSLVDTVYKCTIVCIQTLSTQSSTSSMNGLEAHVATCYDSCSKDFQISQSDEKLLQMFWKLMENICP